MAKPKPQAPDFSGDDLFKRAALGIETRHFFYSEKVGIHIREQAEKHRFAALEALAAADPDDPKAIRHLQNQVQISDMLVSWIAATIADGEAAEAAIELEETASKEYGVQK